MSTTNEKVETMKVTIYNWNDGEEWTETTNATKCYRGELCVNGCYSERRTVTKITDIICFYYDEGGDYNVDCLGNITKDDYVSWNCYFLEHRKELQDEDGNEYSEADQPTDCKTCKFKKECMSEYGVKDNGTDLDMDDLLSTMAKEDYCVFYQNGQGRKSNHFDCKEKMEFIKIEELEETNDNWENNIHEAYDYWRDTNTNYIWERRRPSAYASDCFITWTNLKETNIENIKDFINNKN